MIKAPSEDDFMTDGTPHFLSFIRSWSLCMMGWLALASSAFGLVSMNMAQTFPATVTLGASNLSGSLLFINTSTAPNNTGNLTVSDIKLTAGCGNSPAPCGSPDPGMFSYRTVIGRAGTAFAGLTFTVSLVDPTTGEVQLVPNSPTLLGPPGSLSATGAIDFTFNVVRSPTLDADPASPGVQTYHLARATGTKDGLSVTAKPSVRVTVIKAQPSLAAATPGTILFGGSISNSATLSGGFSPTGTITFTLFGPDNSGCSGSPIFTSRQTLERRRHDDIRRLYARLSGDISMGRGLQRRREQLEREQELQCPRQHRQRGVSRHRFDSKNDQQRHDCF